MEGVQNDKESGGTVEGRWRDGGGTVEVIVEVEDRKLERSTYLHSDTVLRTSYRVFSLFCYECEKGSAY